MNSVLRGIWAGLIATSTMTTSLFKFHRSLPAGQRSPLPPALLTENILSKLPATFSNKSAGSSQPLSTEAQMEATMASHFGFGAATGVLYSLLAPKLPGSPIVKGMAYGLGVWGATLGYNENEMRHRGSTLLDGRKNKFLAH